MNPPSGLGSMRYVNFVIMRLSSTMRCAIVARFADRPERIIGVGRTPVHDQRPGHGIMLFKPCCHPERARFLCERRTRRTAQSFSRTLRECKSACLARFLNAAYDPHARTPDAPSACESSAPSTRTKLGACCCEPHHS